MTTLSKKARNRLTKYGITVEQYEREELLGNMWCSTCKRFLSKDSFVPSTWNRHAGRTCKACRRIYTQAYNLKNKARINARQREYTAAHLDESRQRSREWWSRRSAGERKVRARRFALKTRYGLTPDMYDAMLSQQGGGCAVCGKAGADRSLQVDHDHSCCPCRKSCGDCLRGIICNYCNVLIGYLENNRDKIPKCEAYLNGANSNFA